MRTPRFSAETEYDTLRNELLQNKKYVFERPILIITGSITLGHFIFEDYSIYIPIILIGLLYFNLWFTVNRMGSMARIVAYIQLFLEDKEGNWFGWETSLRYYRVWLKKENTSVDKIKIDEDTNYDNLGYYPNIYYMHIVVIVLAFFALVYYTYTDFEYKNIIACILTFALLILFLVFAIMKRPKNEKQLIEKNRYIWKKVSLGYKDLKTMSDA